MDDKYWFVVPAAGVGKRMRADKPKQYLEIDGCTIAEHTLFKLTAISQIEKIIVVVSEDDNDWQQLEAAQHSKIETVIGGQERCHSVLNALKHISGKISSKPSDWVLVHDIARPCVRMSDIDNLIKNLSMHDVGGMLGAPVRDTMKRTDEFNAIDRTIDRAHLWHAYTPQMFRLGLLHDSLTDMIKAGQLPTDEAAAVEYACHQSVMVEGHMDNIKITHPDDLEFAELILKYRD